MPNLLLPTKSISTRLALVFFVLISSTALIQANQNMSDTRLTDRHLLSSVDFNSSRFPNQTSLRIRVSLPLKFSLNQTHDSWSGWNRFDDEGNSDHRRTKRGIIQLAGMIKCMTGCEPLSYGRYGCFCGYMGAGIPVDPIDKCCRNHDRCYSHSSCSQILQYLLPYKWKCMGNGMVKCSIPDRDMITSKCAYQLCECDRRLGECLRNYKCPRSKPSCPFPRH